MGYAKKQATYSIPGGGVLIPWIILNCPAYRDLAPSAAKALPFFLGKVKCGKRTGLVYGSIQYYDREFRFSYREAKRYGFASSTFHNVIQDIIKKGFVDPVCKGGFKSSGLSYSWFKLSPRWQAYGTPDFVKIEWKTLIPKPRKKRISRLSENGISFVDFRDTKLLVRYLTEQGKIVPRRTSGNTPQQQRQLSIAIKRARHLALLPFVSDIQR